MIKPIQDELSMIRTCLKVGMPHIYIDLWKLRIRSILFDTFGPLFNFKQCGVCNHYYPLPFVITGATSGEGIDICQICWEAKEVYD